jgi:hypothetical protein
VAKKDFYDVNHANLRLSGTIVRLGGLPIYISEVNQDWSVRAKYLISYKDLRIPDLLKSEALDISPVPLGFCQMGETCSYLMRMPRRRTKQGLSEDSINSHDGPHNYIMESKTYSQSLGNTIINNYPPLEAAIKMLGKGFHSVGIARNWALYRYDTRTLLLYKYYGQVGELANGVFSLTEEYRYLQESLDEELKNG